MTALKKSLRVFSVLKTARDIVLDCLENADFQYWFMWLTIAIAVILAVLGIVIRLLGLG